MFWYIPKGWLITAITGTGIAVPLATVGGSTTSSTLSRGRRSAGTELEGVGEESHLSSGYESFAVLDGWAVEENTLSPIEKRGSEALQELGGKNCKQIKNPALSRVWFGSLWICGEGKKDENTGYSVASFYFLDKDREDSLEGSYLIGRAVGEGVISDREDSLAKKVVSVTYSPTSVLDAGDKKDLVAGQGGAHITLGLDKWGKRELEVPLDSIWKNFKGENPSESCKVGTMKIGGDLLQCELQDSEDAGKRANYYFSIT